MGQGLKCTFLGGGLWVIQMCWVLVGKVEYVSSPWDCDSAPFEGFSLTWSLKVFLPGLLAFLSLFLGLMVSSFHGFVASKVYCLDCWVYNLLGLLISISIFFTGLLLKHVGT